MIIGFSFICFRSIVPSRRISYYLEEPIRFYDSRDNTFEGYLYVGAEIEIRDGYYFRGSLCMELLPHIHRWPDSFVRAYNYLLERYHAATNSGIDLMAELDAILGSIDGDIIARAIDGLVFDFISELDDANSLAASISPAGNLVFADENVLADESDASADYNILENVPNENNVFAEIVSIDAIHSADIIASNGDIFLAGVSTTDNVQPVTSDASVEINDSSNSPPLEIVQPVEDDLQIVDRFFDHIPPIVNAQGVEYNVPIENFLLDDLPPMEYNLPVEVIEYNLNDVIDRSVSPMELDDILREFAEIASQLEPYDLNTDENSFY
jgi:hypothetical protein